MCMDTCGGYVCICRYVHMSIGTVRTYIAIV